MVAFLQKQSRKQAFQVLPYTALLLVQLGCSSAQKKETSIPHLTEYRGQKVALVQIEAEATPRSMVEVALVNQLLDHGTFFLLPKQDIEKARTKVEVNPRDLLDVAKEAGADVALEAKVLEFKAEEHEGYSKEEKYDSQLAEERGEKEAIDKNYYKVKALEGEVRIKLTFTDLKTGKKQEGIAEASEKVTADARQSAIHLPPKLRFLESLTQTAFKNFFKHGLD